MHVAVCKLTLLIPGSHSLKDKRAVVRRVKDRVAQRFHVVLVEVGGLDTWQRAELGFAVVSGERAHANDTLDAVMRFVRNHGIGEGLGDILAERRDVFAYGDDSSGWRGPDGTASDAADDELARAAGDAGSSDKAAADDGDDSWIPAAWREESP